MKKLILLLMLLSACIFAQRKTVIEGDVENGGFGGPVVKFSTINKNFGLFVGGYGGWLINHKFLLGGGGYGLVNNIKAGSGVRSHFNLTGEPYLEFGYGGLILEYYFMPDEVLHYSVSVLVGAGGISYREKFMGNFLGDFNYNNESNNDAVFVLEPGLSGELNVAKYLKIGFGVSYRYVGDVGLYGLKSSDLSNVAANIAFKFGKF